MGEKLEKFSNWTREFLDVVTAKRVTVVAILFASLIGPGFLILYRFKPQQLQSWEMGRIILFCLSIGIASILFNALFLTLGFSNADWKDSKAHERTWIAAIALSAGMLYSAHFVTALEKVPTFHGFYLGTLQAHGFLGVSAVGAALIVKFQGWRARRVGYRDGDGI